MTASNYVHLDVQAVLNKTDRALLVRLQDGEEVWLPLSQVADADDYQLGDTDCTVSVTKWLADREGLS